MYQIAPLSTPAGCDLIHDALGAASRTPTACDAAAHFHHGAGASGRPAVTGICRRQSAEERSQNFHVASTAATLPRTCTPRFAGCAHSRFPRSRLLRVRPRASRSDRRHTSCRTHRRTAWHPPSDDLQPTHRRSAVRGQDLRPHQQYEAAPGSSCPSTTPPAAWSMPCATATASATHLGPCGARALRGSPGSRIPSGQDHAPSQHSEGDRSRWWRPNCVE